MYKVNGPALKARCGSASRMAKKVDCTESMIFKLLSGERFPRYDLLCRFKAAYGLTAAEMDALFFAETEPAGARKGA